MNMYLLQFIYKEIFTVITVITQQIAIGCAEKTTTPSVTYNTIRIANNGNANAGLLYHLHMYNGIVKVNYLFARQQQGGLPNDITGIPQPCNKPDTY